MVAVADWIGKVEVEWRRKGGLGFVGTRTRRLPFRVWEKESYIL
jgi:hypothetical protein